MKLPALVLETYELKGFLLGPAKGLSSLTEIL